MQQRFSRFGATSLLLFLALSSAYAVVADQGRSGVLFLLVGDSTTASSGGWGDDFLTLLTNGACGKNFAKRGTTTVSFQKQRLWSKVMSVVDDARDKSLNIYVTIQFGHNDQKHISEDEYRVNLDKLAKQVKNKNAIPVLITPLTRRVFSDNQLKDSLARQRELTLQVAKQAGYKFIDLNSGSRKYIQAIGSSLAAKYNLQHGDSTHLNHQGGQIFARMVADLLADAIPDTKSHFIQDAKTSSALQIGEFIDGVEHATQQAMNVCSALPSLQK